MGKFTKLRKNKKFSYSPRYYNDNGEGSPFKIQHKLDRYRTTVDSQGGLKGRFKNAMADLRRAGDTHTKTRFLIILAVLILIFLYIIDFDLSIFYNS